MLFRSLSPALCAILLKPHDPDAKKKSTLASRFHASFNAAYDTVLKKYKKRVLFFIQKPVLTIGSVVVGFALLIFLMKVTPTGLVPNEDTGTIMMRCMRCGWASTVLESVPSMIPKKAWSGF